jgi:hypothetical protein
MRAKDVSEQLRSRSDDADRAGIVAARKAAIFFSQNRPGRAEDEVVRALACGQSPDQVAEMLAPVQTPHAITRRQALKRTGALLAAGVAWPLLAPRGLGTRAVLADAPTTAGDQPTGLLLKVPTAVPASWQLEMLTTDGLVSIPGSYAGTSTVYDGQIINSQHQWASDGTPQTVITTIDASGSSESVTVPYPESVAQTDGADSFTTVVARGSLVYSLHVIIQLYRSPVGSPGMPADKAQRSVSPIAASGQLAVVVVDTASSSLAGFWLGDAVMGSMATTMLVSADGTGVLVAQCPPGSPAAYTLLSLGNNGLSPIATSVAPALLVPTFAGTRPVDWPSLNSVLRQVGANYFQVFDPSTGNLNLQPLTAPGLVGSRMPPTYQALWSTSPGLISSGNGQIYSVGGYPSTPVPVANLVPTTDDPGLAYQGPQLEGVWAAAADGTVLMVDNRLGIGGLWRFEPSQTSPAQQLLSGNYFSQIVADDQERWIAANNPTERATYLIDLELGQVTAFQVPVGARLIGGGL